MAPRYCPTCKKDKTHNQIAFDETCIDCGTYIGKIYNATEALKQEIVDIVEDALVRAGIKYRRVYFDNQGVLQIEKERE